MTVPSSSFERLDPWRVRIRPFRPGMAECVVYASRALLPQLSDDATLDQVANVAMLPGIVGPSMVMPDAHQGYGFPIGGVAATDAEDGGVVSPGGVGFDINCGVRLLATSLAATEAAPHLRALLAQVFRDVPVGFGSSRDLRLSDRDLVQVLARGAAWVVEEGMGQAADLERQEARGGLREADPDAVSRRARERGAAQLGTLGSGNHFIEFQRVAAVTDAEAARTMGFQEGSLVVLVHTGSRGLGHQVCSDHVAILDRAMARYGIRVPDRQLACAPIHSPEGRAYLGAMAAAANFAWANRQVITHRVRDGVRRVFGGDASVQVVWDVAHNMAKLERHLVDGRERRLCVHRKGATRAFPAGHPELPPVYRDLGQPVFIPGSMGTSSEVLLGTERAMAETWGSVCHGAGRVMSRNAAKRAATAEEVLRSLEARGVLIQAGSKKGVAEEAPEAYKDVTEVVDTVVGAGLARRVARLEPVGVIKG